MSSTSRGVSRIASAMKTPSTPRQHICLSCRRALSRTSHNPSRGYSSTATATATIEAPPIPQHVPTKTPASPIPEEQALAKIHAGVLLSRPPLITRDPHPFETAFYLYQRRLNERLVLPFTQYFYFKRGTPAFEHWRTRRRERNNTATRDIGNYNPYKEDGWNDEVLVGEKVGEPDQIVKRLLEDEGKEVAESIDAETAKVGELGGLRRRTEADESCDMRSLERKLERTLYLVVKKGSSGKAERWEFPDGPIEGVEGLKEGAMRILDTSCGPNMNTWFVGNHPVGHMVHIPRIITEPKPKQMKPPQEGPKDTKKEGKGSKKVHQPVETHQKALEAEKVQFQVQPTQTPEVSPFYKTFFMKARIMAGQADVANPSGSGAEDFKWLAKDEIEKVFDPAYWARVKNMLVEQ